MNFLVFLITFIGISFIVLKIMGLRIIPNNKIGIVEKWWSPKGSLSDKIIALDGEAGIQAEVLRGGIHFRSPIMYKIHILPLVTIPQGQIGYVFARDGKPLDPTQTLAKVVSKGNNFQDVRGFLYNGGQKGQQREIVREGTYAFNLAQFIIFTSNRVYYFPLENTTEKDAVDNMHKVLLARDAFYPIVIRGNEDKIGILTTHDGKSLPNGQIIAPIVGDNPNNQATYHNNFQDIEKFLLAGGFRGRQHHVLVDGTYYINRLFATVELINKTIIDVGYVGVVVSYTGEKGTDQSGDAYTHGELVEKGYSGVWSEPLMPGKYAFNTYSGKIIPVPTTNIILKWISTQFGTHKYDENLKEVSLITKDAFEPLLPLSIVIHIDYKKAPLVIQRFGDITKLVEQSLDPMISSYFKNIGQTKTLIELIHNRRELQDIAHTEMAEKFDRYNLELEEVLIGTPSSSPNDTKIETILTQLRERQIAEEKVKTYEVQQRAATKERELRESEAKAEQQKNLTASSIDIEVEENKGKAEYKKATQEAEKIKILASAEAEKIRTLANGEAEKIRILADGESEKIKKIAEAEAEKEAQVGIGKAIAMEEQVNAYGGAKYQIMQDIMVRFTDAIKQGNIDIVPKTIISMGGNAENNSSFNAFEALISLILSEKLGVDLTNKKDDNEKIKKMKDKIMNSISE
ncbi:MAG: SPFH domain-containing protein [Candidatus Sericytochromatia bacterium]